MEMDTDAVISYAAVVEELWPVIEPYLSFTDHVVASKTCRALQKMIIDEDTKKVKMSQFIGGFDYSEGTQDGSIPQYLSPLRWIQYIFPSLREIALKQYQASTDRTG